DHRQPHLLELGLIPDVDAVPEAVIEHAALAVRAGPDDSKVAVPTVDTLPRKVDLALVEPEQHPNPGPREALDLVDLILECELAREVPQAGEGWVLDDQGSRELAPGVAVKGAAEHGAVLRPGEERDGGAVDADESLAVVADERQQVGLLRVVHVE